MERKDEKERRKKKKGDRRKGLGLKTIRRKE